MKRKEAFDEIAELYDDVRPSYPQKLINDMILKTGISKDDSLLEIGAGTGIATLHLARYGYRVHCIEPARNLVNIFNRKLKNYDNVSVDVSTFEDWQTNFRYDLIYSAQAFHWIERDIKYKKCCELLKDEGYLALFWYQPSDEYDPILRRIREMVESHIPFFYKNDHFRNTNKETMEMRQSEIAASGYFENLETFLYKVKNSVGTEQYVKIFNSNSNFIVLEESLKVKINNQIRKIINDNGGKVNTSLLFTLYISKKPKEAQGSFFLLPD